MSNMPAHKTATLTHANFTGRAPRIALARAEAAVTRLAAKLSKGLDPPSGNRLVDALAAIAFDADECRMRAWSRLANLRRHACAGGELDGPDYDRRMLRHELQTLGTLAARRRRALRDDGAAEEVYRWHVDRSMLASWRSDDLYQLAKSREDEFSNAPDNATSTVLAIEAALMHARSDAWRYIALLHDVTAMGKEVNSDRLVDLRACRAEIVGLNVLLRAAEADTLAGYGA